MRQERRLLEAGEELLEKGTAIGTRTEARGLRAVATAPRRGK
jgi:hypothetical protein